MAAASSSTIFFGTIYQENNQNGMKEQDFITEPPVPPPQLPQKRKRNQPGNPNPDSEVIALSPKTLMATNRFMCEVCQKGFQREQNLQLHRRGHNLPWKLKQKSTKEVKRKVYLCPEPTCVHHDPSRALGDLTGIKKHFSRKHGEKKFKCEKCSKKYAVNSDWKAHSKTCGTREYRCDCGTVFSRRDSFITHRAFCDALAQETARAPLPTMNNTMGVHMYGNNNNDINFRLSQNPEIQDQKPSLPDLLGLTKPQIPPFPNLHGSTFRPPQTLQSQNVFFMDHEQPQMLSDENPSQLGLFPIKQFNIYSQHYNDMENHNETEPHITPDFFNLGFFPNGNKSGEIDPSSNMFLHDHHNSNTDGTASVHSLYSTSPQAQNVSSHMSATALLQKAAQLGSTSSNNSTSLLKNFGSSSSSSGAKYESNYSELMNSLGGGCFGGYGGSDEHYGGYDGKKSTMGLNEETTNGLINFGAMRRGSTIINGGGAENLTRDFLGVGEMVTNMNALDNSDANAKAAPLTHVFGGGAFHPKF
jgi:hypothetical protein